MNENLDLTKILRNCPEGIILYSTLCGEVKFKGTAGDIIVAYTTEYGDEIDFNKNGSFYRFNCGECVLFPSKDNHDWSTFKVPNKLPKTWKEFCENNPIKNSEYYITSNSCINRAIADKRENGDDNLLPNKETAEAMLALCQLIQLRDCYNDGWKPDYTNKNDKYVINVDENEISRTIVVTIQNVLTFKTRELRDTFLNNFKDLIEIAKPLL